MNKYLALVSVILFFIAVIVPVLMMSGTFIPVSQNITFYGYDLFNQYIVPFELISVVIVGAILGIIYVARGDE
ncbi:hypothetical protein DMB44_05830 [Thermoplasma sp. Kam2015]|uniref:hypothetical protein n=1 Tax=Thermoplasma sp. Kam2015 TaxID=2094122 RepID=UPI000D81E700|nr:hypothetical protein [Thermoplasma sp. Kam2015]PYB68021.1 hypothetical protein DMB44_05830 [Thermoplasma sp. Kam2015]